MRSLAKMFSLLVLAGLTACSFDEEAALDEIQYQSPEELQALTYENLVQPQGYTIFMVDLSDSVSAGSIRDRLYVDATTALNRGEWIAIVQIGANSGTSDSPPLKLGPIGEYGCKKPPIRQRFGSYNANGTEQHRYELAEAHVDAELEKCKAEMVTEEEAFEQLGAYFSDQLAGDQRETNIRGAIQQADALRPKDQFTTFVLLSDMWEQTTADNLEEISFSWNNMVALQVHQFQPGDDASREGEWQPMFYDWGASSISWQWLVVSDHEQGVAPAFTGQRRVHRETVQRKPTTTSGTSKSKSKASAPATSTGCPRGQVWDSDLGACLHNGGAR